MAYDSDNVTFQFWAMTIISKMTITISKMTIIWYLLPSITIISKMTGIHASLPRYGQNNILDQ